MSDLPGNFTRTQINQALEVLGLDPSWVESITISEDRVTVTTNYQITDGGSGVFPVQRELTVIPVQFGEAG